MSRLPTSDSGLRYEVTATGYPDPGETVIGWSGTMAGAERMVRAIRKAPGCTSAAWWDRRPDLAVEELRK